MQSRFFRTIDKISRQIFSREIRVIVAVLVLIACLYAPAFAKEVNHPFVKLTANLRSTSKFGGGLFKTASHSQAISISGNYAALVNTEFRFNDASYSYRVVLEVWELSGSRRVASATIDDTNIQSIAISENGKHIVTSGYQEPYCIYRIKNGKLVGMSTYRPVFNPMTGEKDYIGIPVAISNDGRLVATHDLSIWTTKNWKRSARLKVAVPGIDTSYAEPIKKNGFQHLYSARFTEDGRSVRFGITAREYKKSGDSGPPEIPSVVGITCRSNLNAQGGAVGPCETRTRDLNKFNSTGDSYVVLDPSGIAYSLREENNKRWLYREDKRLFSYGNIMEIGVPVIVSVGKYVLNVVRLDAAGPPWGGFFADTLDATVMRIPGP